MKVMTTMRSKYIRQPQNSVASETLPDGMSIVIGVLAILVAAYLSNSLDSIVPMLVLGLILAVLIIRYSFLGWLIFVGMIPFESAFLALGGGEISFTRVLGLFLFGLWILKHTIGKHPIAMFPSSKWLLPLLFWAAISVLWAIDRNQSIGNWLTLLQMFLMNLIIYNEVKDYKQLYWMLMTFLLSCVLAAVPGYFRVDILEARSLLTLGSTGAKEYAAIIGMAFLSGVILFALSQKKIHKVIFLMMAAICIYPLFAVGERGVLLAIVTGWMVVILFSIRKFSKIAYSVFIALLGYGVFQFAVQNGYMSNYMLSRFDWAQIIETGGAGRVGIWKVGIEMFVDHPILGVGLGNFPISYLHYAPNFFGASQGLKGPHNDLLSIGTELGIVGLILFLGMLIHIWARFAPLLKMALERPEIYSPVILLLGLWVFVFSAGLTSVFINRKFYWLIIILVEIVIKLFNDAPELDFNVESQTLHSVHRTRKPN